MRKRPDLKPCPFCRGQAAITKGREWLPHRRWYIVYCQECCAGTGQYITEQMAVDAWNRRVNDANA